MSHGKRYSARPSRNDYEEAYLIAKLQGNLNKKVDIVEGIHNVRVETLDEYVDRFESIFKKGTK